MSQLGSFLTVDVVAKVFTMSMCNCFQLHVVHCSFASPYLVFLPALFLPLVTAPPAVWPCRRRILWRSSSQCSATVSCCLLHIVQMLLSIVDLATPNFLGVLSPFHLVDRFSTIPNFFCNFKNFFPHCDASGFSRCQIFPRNFVCLHFSAVSCGLLSVIFPSSVFVSKNVLLHFFRLVSMYFLLESVPFSTLVSVRLGMDSCHAFVSTCVCEHCLV